MWACERGVFVKAGAQNGEMFSSGRGFAFCVFTVVSMLLFAVLIKIVAICECFVSFVCLLFCLGGGRDVAAFIYWPPKGLRH